jgi:hypothetical protein
MLLEIVLFAGDVADDFKAVGQTHARHFAQSRIRLLWRCCVNTCANASFLRAFDESRDLVADFLFAVAKGWESIFQGVAGIVSTVIGEALAQVGSFASNIPGFGALGDSMKAAGEALKTSGSEFFQKSVDAAEASGKALKDAWSGREPEKAGEALAGPLTASIDDAIARARAAAGDVDVAGKQKLDVKQTATIDDSKVRESVKGLDVRSAEGMKEMLRLVRGGGQDVQQQQLSELQRIAANTEDMGLDIEEADLPQTAGAY